MIYDLFTNSTILASFLLVIGQIFKCNSFDSKQSLKTQSILGLTFGLLGIILMLFAIRMTDTIIIDLRNISIICAGIFGGPFSAIIAAVIIALFRVIYFGMNTASIVAHLAALLSGGGIAYISVTKLVRHNKYIIMFLFSMVTSNAALIYLISDKNKLIETLFFYWPIHVFGALVAYFTSQYIFSANLNFKTMMYYRITADNLSDMISTHEPGGKVKFVSPPVRQLFGYTQDEFVGTLAYEYIHPEDISIIKEKFSTELDTKDISVQVFRMKHSNGSYIWVESSVRIIRNSDCTAKEIICVTRDVTLRKLAEAELEKDKLEAERLASIDCLTGTLNRRAFERRFDEEINRVRREKSSISIILVDVDHFKKINDTYGHQVGDITLQKLVECLINTCRPYDFIGRLGGEEFIICLPNTNREQAITIAERMRETIERMEIKLSDKEESVKVTASFGVSSPTQVDEEDIHFLILQADRAMYKAKACGRNRVCIECRC